MKTYRGLWVTAIALVIVLLVLFAVNARAEDQQTLLPSGGVLVVQAAVEQAEQSWWEEIWEWYWPPSYSMDLFWWLRR